MRRGSLLVNYCIDPNGQVTSAEAGHSQAPDQVANRVRGWSFEPWPGAPDARFCESALLYEDANTFGRWAESEPTTMVFLPIVPPMQPLPQNNSLDQAPARLLHEGASVLRAFWDISTGPPPQGPWKEFESLPPGYGELVLRLCVDGDGGFEVRDVQRHLDWLPERQQWWLELLLMSYSHDWQFTPRLEGGVPVDDCGVEVRYAVWITHHYALGYHGRLSELLDIGDHHFEFEPEPDELAPWAEHGPIHGLDGAPPPAMIEAPSWLPPYELATTMPLDMASRTVRVRFCVPATGGHPTEVRVLDSDVQESERAVLRLVAEGVARWRAVASEEDAASRCGEVEWQIGRRSWPLSQSAARTPPA